MTKTILNCKFDFSSLKLIKGDMSTLIQQIELTLVSTFKTIRHIFPISVDRSMLS